MFLENRSGFFPRHYPVQPVKYDKVYSAWGAVFQASNGDEYILVLHLQTESFHRAAIRAFQHGQPHNIRATQEVKGYRLFKLVKGRSLRSLTGVSYNLDSVVEVLLKHLSHSQSVKA